MGVIFYLTTILIQSYFFIYRRISINSRLKKDGYTFVKTVYAKLNVIEDILFDVLLCFLPGVGILCAICDSYDDTKREFLWNGSILKSDNHEILPNTEPQRIEQKEAVQEGLTDSHQETEKQEFYLANKEKFDMFYQYMTEYIKQEVENQILSQMPPINVDDYSLDELKNILAQFQNLQTKEDGKSPKTKC